MKRLLFSLLALAVFFATPVFAMSLEEAKSQGLVGERRNGYLDVVAPNAPPDVRSLVSDVNAKRKAAYSQIAQKNGSPLSVVEQVGAKEAFEKSPKGTMLEASGGGWVKKS